MHRKLTVLLVAIFALVAFVGTMAIAADPPGEMVIDKAMNKKSGVKFNHTEHSESIDCLKCHHTAESKDAISKSCFECHGKDENAPDPSVSSAKENPFHVLCRGCHKEQGKGPTKCKECHP